MSPISSLHIPKPDLHSSVSEKESHLNILRFTDPSLNSPIFSIFFTIFLCFSILIIILVIVVQLRIGKRPFAIMNGIYLLMYLLVTIIFQNIKSESFILWRTLAMVYLSLSFYISFFLIYFRNIPKFAIGLKAAAKSAVSSSSTSNPLYVTTNEKSSFNPQKLFRAENFLSSSFFIFVSSMLPMIFLITIGTCMLYRAKEDPYLSLRKGVGGTYFFGYPFLIPIFIVKSIIFVATCAILFILHQFMIWQRKQITKKLSSSAISKCDIRRFRFNITLYFIHSIIIMIAHVNTSLWILHFFISTYGILYLAFFGMSGSVRSEYAIIFRFRKYQQDKPKVRRSMSSSIAVSAECCDIESSRPVTAIVNDDENEQNAHSNNMLDGSFDLGSVSNEDLLQSSMEKDISESCPGESLSTVEKYTSGLFEKDNNIDDLDLNAYIEDLNYVQSALQAMEKQ